MFRRLAPRLAWWPALFGIWVLFVGTRSPAELLVGAGCAALAAVGVEAVRHESLAGVRPRARWLSPALGIPARVVVDTGLVLWALLRHLARRRPVTGSLRAYRVDPGDENEGDATTRTALRLWLASSPPNTFALGIEGDVMLVHELVRTGRRPPGLELGDS